MWYYSNKSAWMTGEIWMKILNRLNKQIRNNQIDRNILLFIDNCPAHLDNGIKFSNITIRFLSKNTTSVLQPFDQGIIKCFKGYYKLRGCRKLMNAINLFSNEIAQNVQKFKPTLIKFFDCCDILTSAWQDVATDTIINCFHHSGFHEAKEINEDFQIEQISKSLEDYNKIESQFYQNFPDFVFW